MGFKTEKFLPTARALLYQPRGSYRNQSGDNDRDYKITPTVKVGIISAGDEGKVLVRSRTPSVAEAEDRGIGEMVRAHITELTVEEDYEMATSAQVTIADPLNRLADSAIMTRGTILDISVGYDGNTLFKDRFEMVGVNTEFSRDGIPIIKLKGYDGRVKMTLGDYLPHKREEQRHSKQRELGAFKPKNRKRTGAANPPKSFKKKRDSEIADEVAGYFGYMTDIEPTGKRRNRIKKKGTSYWEFMLNIARDNNFVTWVDWSTSASGSEGWCLHFRRKVEEFKEGYAFEYNPNMEIESRSGRTGFRTVGGGLLNASVSIDLPTQATDIEVSYFDKKKVNLGRRSVVLPVYDQKTGREMKDANGRIVTRNEKRTIFGGRVRFLLGGRVVEAINHIPFKNKKEAQQFALAWMLKREEDLSTVDGTIIGTENVRARQVHKLIGLGNTFSGDYYFTQVTHKFSSTEPYTTDFVAYRIVEDEVNRIDYNININGRVAGKAKVFNFNTKEPPGVGNRFRNGIFY